MTTAAPAPLSPAALLGQQAGDAQRYRALLHELMDMGMGMVRTVHEQATAKGADPAAAHEAARAFDLLSRAVRRTVALARRVAEPLPARADPAREHALARRGTVGEVENVSQWPDSALGLALDAEAAEAFRAELSERLDSPDLDDEGGCRPIEDVIADICRDLGLGRCLGGQPRAPRTPPDMRAPCARAAQSPSAPGQAASPTGIAHCVEPHPGRPPFTPEGGTAPPHEGLARRNE